MKVGIMSMQRVLNYGSYLQAYSLKNMLQKIGAQVEFVDYRPSPCVYENEGKLKRKLRTFKYYLKKTKTWDYIKENFLGIGAPAKNRLEVYFKDSFRLLDVGEKNYKPKLDVLIIGSDEVFNCLQDSEKIGYAKDLFGAHNRAKKLISYAASFGNTTLERLDSYGVKKEVQKMLKRFDALSLRDSNSGYIAQILTGKEVQYHLDPVLVGDFSDLIEDNVQIENYIIVYGYIDRFTAEEGEKITEFARRVGKKVVTLCDTQRFGDMHIDCTPTEILAYFKHAHCVFTDTFHGSIFSIINHKPFATFIRSSKDGAYGNQEKLTDMLERMGLESQIVNSLNDLTDIIEKDIDYSAVDSIRKSEREKSLAYLEKFVKD